MKQHTSSDPAKWVKAVLVGALFLWLPTSVATAHPFLIDQRNDSFPSTGGFGFGASPLGQEFTPTLAALDVVELLIGPRFPNSVAVVNIRIGSIGGPIIGTSLPAIIGASANTFEHFDFSSIVSLVPENLYVLQPVLLQGGFGPVFSDTDTYARGRGIAFGSPVSGSDMGFREGVAVPEPTTAVLFGIGIGMVGLNIVVVRCRKAVKARKSTVDALLNSVVES